MVHSWNKKPEREPTRIEEKSVALGVNTAIFYFE